MPGRVEIIEDGTDVTITLGGNNANIAAGGNGEDGQLIIRDIDGSEILRLSIVKNEKGRSIGNVVFDGSLEFTQGNQKALRMGTAALDIYEPISGKPTINLTAALTGPIITMGGNARAGTLKLLDKEDQVGTQITGGSVTTSSVSASSFNAKSAAGQASINGDGIRLSKEGRDVATIEGGLLRLGNTGLGGRLIITTEDDNGIRLGGEQPQIKIGTRANQGSLNLSPESVSLHSEQGMVFQLLPSGVVRAGGANTSGELSLRDENGKERIRLTAGMQKIFLKTENEQIVFQVDSFCDLSLGGSGKDGDIFLKSRSGAERLHLGADEGQIVLKDEAGETVFSVNENGRLALKSGSGESGVSLKRSNGQTTAVLGSNGQLSLGGGGVDGDISLKGPDGTQTAVISSRGNLLLGGGGVNAGVRLRGPDGKQTAMISDRGDLLLGGGGTVGNVKLYPSTVRNGVPVDNGSSDDWSIHLDGEDGDIFLKNADCAEEFDITDAENVEPGTVVVIDETGRLSESQEAYDKRVAGVISGAGVYRPGIILDKKPRSKERKPVALVGKVYCKVDAGFGAIAIGDLLTTSPTHGCAMKVTDPFKAFGAVIGKALRPLSEGKGLIPILIALQ